MRNNLVLSTCFSEGFFSFLLFSSGSTCARSLHVLFFFSFFFLQERCSYMRQIPALWAVRPPTGRSAGRAAGATASACQKPQCETADHRHEMIAAGEEGEGKTNISSAPDDRLLPFPPIPPTPHPPLMWLPCSWAAAHIASDLTRHAQATSKGRRAA